MLPVPVVDPDRGQYPHTSGIFTNAGDDRGYAEVKERGLENQTFAVALQAAGYQTSFLGKYFNGYNPIAGNQRSDYLTDAGPQGQRPHPQRGQRRQAVRDRGVHLHPRTARTRRRPGMRLSARA